MRRFDGKQGVFYIEKYIKYIGRLLVKWAEGLPL